MRTWGSYSAIVLIAEALNIIPMIVMPSLLPDIVAAKDNPRNSSTNASIISTASWHASPTRVHSLSLSFLSGSCLCSSGRNMLLEDRCSRCSPLRPSSLSWVWRAPLFVTMNLSKTHLTTVATSCALNVLLNLALIPNYGALGAAIASAIAYWFAVHGICLCTTAPATGGMVTSALLWPKFWNS